MIAEHTLVALTVDRPADKLRRGDVGAVVHVYSGGVAFEVEFVNEQGRTIAVATVPVGDLIKLNFLRLSA